MATTIPAGSPTPSRNLIAPVWHTIVVLLLFLVPLITGVFLQSGKTSNNQIFASHSSVMLSFYLPVLILEWLLVLFIWRGTRKAGVTLSALIGGRWKNWKDVAIDLALALAVCIAMLAVGGILAKLLPASTAKGVSIILPQGAFEMLIWLCVSVTAGFVEELVFRGYLLTQFVRMGLRPAWAILAQALVFAFGHIYEGRNAVITIALYALMFGMLAVWRKSLRPGMVGHAVFDAVAPLLSRV